MKCSDSASKAIIPGQKDALRLYDENGQAQCDLIAMDGEVIEAGKPVTMVNLDPDAIERTVTITPSAVKPLLVPHILGGELAIQLPSIAEKKAYIARQLTTETWESELRLECPHKHYVNMTPAVADCRSKNVCGTPRRQGIIFACKNQKRSVLFGLRSGTLHFFCFVHAGEKVSLAGYPVSRTVFS